MLSYAISFKDSKAFSISLTSIVLNAAPKTNTQNIIITIAIADNTKPAIDTPFFLHF